MSRRTQIIIFIAAVLMGASIAVFVAQNKDKKEQANTSQPSDAPISAFDPASTEEAEFKATITTAKDGKETTATLEHDDQGNSRYVQNLGGAQTEVIYTSDAYYACQTGGTCIKFPLSQSGESGVNPSDYTYSDAELENYRSGAKYEGKQSCPSGTCDVWKTTAGGAISVIYIDSTTKRISQIATTIGGTATRIVYDYTDVTITVPANAQEFTPPGQ